VPEHVRDTLIEISCVVRDFREGRGQEEEEAGSSTAADRDAESFQTEIPQVLQTDSLTLAVLDEGVEVYRRVRSAAFDQETGSILVSGESDEYAGELSEVLVDLLHLSQQGKLAARLGSLLASAGRPQGFRRGLERLRRDLGLTAASTPEEVPPQTPERAPSAMPPQEAVRSGSAEDPARAALTPTSQPPRTRRPAGSINASRQRMRTRRRSAAKGSAGQKGQVDRAQPDASFTMERTAQMVRSLSRQLEELRTTELLPDVAAGSDEEYRHAAMEYERKHGRYPEEKPSKHPGFDLESFDLPPGVPERRVLRRIEVKGHRGTWSGDEAAVLSHIQFRRALEGGPDGCEYWLCVVSTRDHRSYMVLPIPNPARTSRRYALRAGVWVDLAVDAAEVDLSG
jgi:hypothetical protein